MTHPTAIPHLKFSHPLTIIHHHWMVVSMTSMMQIQPLPITLRTQTNYTNRTDQSEIHDRNRLRELLAAQSSNPPLPSSVSSETRQRILSEQTPTPPTVNLGTPQARGTSAVLPAWILRAQINPQNESRTTEDTQPSLGDGSSDNPQ